MTQHVNCFTHRRGHILDLVMTRTSENTIQRIHVEGPGLSDHSAIFFRMTGKLPAHVRRDFQYRLYRSIDTTSSNKDLCTSDLVQNPATSLTARVNQYNTVLGNFLDKHAPIRKRTVIVRPNTEWYSSDIHEAKNKRRRLEQRWRKSKLAIDYDLCANQSKAVRGMVTQPKSDYYSEKVCAAKTDQKALFQIVDKLLHSSLPTHDSLKHLCDSFGIFFQDKFLRFV